MAVRHSVTTVLLLALAVLVGACKQGGDSFSPSAFYNTHDLQAFVEGLAAAEGWEVHGGETGISIGAETAEKDFRVSVKGGDAERALIMRKYKAQVERELKAAGVKIDGRGESGMISGFDFNYEKSNLEGVIRATSHVDSEGTVQIDVFVYEHR